MNFLLAIFILFLAMTVPDEAFAQKSKPKTAPKTAAGEPAKTEGASIDKEELVDWATYYYLHPDPKKVPEKIQALEQTGAFEGESAKMSFLGFFAPVFRANPDIINPALKVIIKMPPERQVMWAGILWFANTEQSKKMLDKYIAYLTKNGIEVNAGFYKATPPEIDKIPVSSPADLDMMWGAFMATGESKYVIPVIAVLREPENQGNIAQLLVSSAARWSLTSNAIQHKKVLEICVSEVDKQPKDIKEILENVIRNARQGKKP